jgi:hypothetical protein
LNIACMIVAFLVLNKFLWEINLDFRTTNEIESLKKPIEVLEDSNSDAFKTKDSKSKESKTIEPKSKEIQIKESKIDEFKIEELKFDDLETFEPKIEATNNEEIKENKESQTEELNFEETKIREIQIVKSKTINDNASLAVSFGLGRLGNQANILNPT